MNTVGTLRDWALGIGAALLVMTISLALIIVTKPQVWTMERYAVVIAAVFLGLPLLFRRLKSIRNH